MRTFERARPQDAETIARLFEEAKRVGKSSGTTDWDESYPTREYIDEDIARGELWALTEDGRLIAAISLLEEDFENGLDAGWTDVPSCVLTRLCVDPHFQGRGIGAEMMRRITKEAARFGFHATRHLASVNNPAALHLYRKLGYRELRQVRFFGSDFIAFELLIPEEAREAESRHGAAPLGTLPGEMISPFEEE
jgi:ribosomal protein S18 acetylase RimI-like enzyme